MAVQGVEEHMRVIFHVHVVSSMVAALPQQKHDNCSNYSSALISLCGSSTEGTCYRAHPLECLRRPILMLLGNHLSSLNTHRIFAASCSKA
eukprot:3571276-Amphidinium_carterae.1